MFHLQKAKIKKQKQKIIYLIAIMGFLLLNSTTGLTNMRPQSNFLSPVSDLLSDSIEVPRGATPHDPIYINGNDWTTCDAVTGSGTENDPYIIADLIIDVNDNSIDGIVIENSQVYGKIKNCTITDGRNGIFVKLSKNCTIFDNDLEGNSNYGINFQNSTYGLILVNSIKFNDLGGIFINSSTYCGAYSNTIKFNYIGITSEESPNSIFVWNNVIDNNYCGFFISYSPNCIFRNNNVNDNGFIITVGTTSHYVGSGIFIRNSPSCELTDNNVTANTEYGIDIRYSDYCEVSMNNASYNRVGLIFFGSSNCEIVQNTGNNNYVNGISFYNSYYCNISKNQASNNAEFGIYLDSPSSNNSLFQNLVIKNFEGGIFDEGNDNILSDNIIIDILRVSFTVSDTFIGQVVNFTDNSTGGNSTFEYFWDFGDNQNSTAQNPSHVYSTTIQRYYTVSLTVIDSSNDTGTFSLDISVIVDLLPVASFYTTNTSNRFYFYDTTSGGDAPLQYFWDFGNGENSTLQNPDFRFTFGNYTVTLTVTDNDGDTSSYSIDIVAGTENVTSDDDSKDENNEGIPGFSLGFLLISAFMVCILIRKRNIIQS